ncbi:MAG: tetrahydromethanopterin S-methyltransferase subunit B [Candidatus Nezhaarchaeota archaeon]|nr:tetrahydromethanopterin S-methyltransferase subunit B [Candidatus Nezhaarchaeota archaeon]MCX8141480.1 tetrahydromethanopterin S-methyltransferase subunit B [Candidatus Nezhaarchaeota archaeon]MDW8049746.1 tetrahydromethanopterin S-methyltransferase subunit B [Nitrososphaerota archaeon]
MSTIIISPDLDVILDAENKIVGEARTDVAILDLSPIERKIVELELLADELVNSLNPKTQPLISSRPRREGLYLKAGFLSNMVIGFLIGLLAFGMGLIAYIALTEPTLISKLVSVFRPPT